MFPEISGAWETGLEREKGRREICKYSLPQLHSVPVDCVTRLLAFQASDEVKLSWFLNRLKGIMYPLLIDRQGNFAVEEGQGDWVARIVKLEFDFSLSFSLSGPCSSSTLDSKCFGFKFGFLFLTLPICWTWWHSPVVSALGELCGPGASIPCTSLSMYSNFRSLISQGKDSLLCRMG